MTMLNPAVGRVLKRPHHPLDVILICLRWCVADRLSLRNLDDMMAERGVSVDHSTVHRSELAHVKHVFVKAAARVNNRAENDRQPTRRRERQMCGFRDARRTQAFLSCFGPIRQHFALPGHQMNAACHRAVLQERFVTWHGWTVTAASKKVT